MELQKILGKVRELFVLITVLVCILWIIVAISTFYYIGQSKTTTSQTLACGVQGSPAVGSLTSELALKGEELFKNNCSQCHSVTNEMIVGPGLQDIQKRRSIRWIRRWVRDSQKLITSGDKYAINLYNKFNMTSMPAFSAFTNQDIDSIISYIAEINQEPLPVLYIID
ncbi:cytochrome c [Emticicia sp. 17c]|uniref:cytochrome c n=1 Tax=Emticicia sp. 17c TaxID=3127704 RepID=UPI00301B801B